VVGVTSCEGLLVGIEYCVVVLQAVTQPELNVRKRMKKNLKKQEAKKRKIVDIRPGKRSKKQKLSLEIPDNVDTF